jgi:hypothetical protein
LENVYNQSALSVKTEKRRKNEKIDYRRAYGPVRLHRIGIERRGQDIRQLPAASEDKHFGADTLSRKSDETRRAHCLAGFFYRQEAVFAAKQHLDGPPFFIRAGFAF